MTNTGIVIIVAQSKLIGVIFDKSIVIINICVFQWQGGNLEVEGQYTMD